MYPGARRHGKSPRRREAIVTAGLRWAPETAPMKRMIAITIRPGRDDGRGRLIAPWLRVDDGRARADEHQQERAEQLREEPPPLERRVVEVEHRRELERREQAAVAPRLRS